MNQNHHQSIYATARAFAAAALVATIAFSAGPAIAAKASGEDRVEARVKDMHARLKITPAQEDQWGKVVQVMRDNEKNIEPLIKARAENSKTMTAVDDLKSYGEITDAHADGVKKFTPVFEALYAEMSDVQKKEADAMFRHGSGKAAKKK